jgi:hypothetical protein
MSAIEKKFLTVKDFCEKQPSWPSESALRAIILGAAWGENKFQSAFKRVGRRVLIDEAEFWLCVDRMQSEPKNV